MLEDLVLMMGALTGAQPQIAEAVGPELNAVAGRLELQAISDARREQLYNVSRETPFDGKIVLTVLEDSTLIGQAARLRSFQVDCELCLSSRAHSVSSVTEAHRG